MSLFHEPNNNIKEVRVICSGNERRAYEERSIFFIHPLFNGKSEWPMKTDIVCFYDEEKFEGIPIPIPVDHNRIKNAYECYGIFCSASCAKAHMETHSSHENAFSMIWLKKIMREVFNDTEDIVAAPSKDLLKRRGGHLNIEEFRKYGQQKTKIITHTLPFFTCSLAFELVQNQTEKNEKNDKNDKNDKTLEQDKKDVEKLKRNIQRKKEHKPFSKLGSIMNSINDSTINNSTNSIVDNIDNHDLLDDSFNDLSNDFLPSPPHVLYDEKQDMDEKTLTSSNTLSNTSFNTSFNTFSDSLSNNVTMVPASVGIQWEINGLRRPDIPIPPQENISKGPCLFQKYLEKKTSETKNDYKPEAIKNDKDPKKEYQQPTKKRGRPPRVQKTVTFQNQDKGNLSSFFKT